MLKVLLSILVYGVMVWVMTYNAKKILNRDYKRTTFLKFITDKNILAPLILFSFLAAIRWDVGVDCRSYFYGFYRGATESELAKGETLFYSFSQ